MRIKLLERVTIGGHTMAPARGSVVEVNDEEGAALVQVGYAHATDEELTDSATLHAISPGGNTPIISGLVENVTKFDAPFDASALVDGTVAEVSERLVGLDAKQLKAVIKAEGKGKDRAGVHSAVEAAQAALDGGEG